MRQTDVMITKPSELAFYPIPKLLIRRVGAHEAYGALRAAEIGDGTIECRTFNQATGMLELLINERKEVTMSKRYKGQTLGNTKNKKLRIFLNSYLS